MRGSHHPGGEYQCFLEGNQGNVMLQGMGISFFCGALTKLAGLTRVKMACVVNRPSPKDKSAASHFHGVTDGPLFRAAAKKKRYPYPGARLTLALASVTMRWASTDTPP